MAGPQTTRDALLAELLGDVGALLDRAEALKTALPEVADVLAERLATAGDASAGKIAQAADQARLKIAKAGDGIAEKLSLTAAEATEAARTVSGSAARFTFLALLVGLLGGVAGGAIITLIIVYGTHGR